MSRIDQTPHYALGRAQARMNELEDAARRMILRPCEDTAAALLTHCEELQARLRELTEILNRCQFLPEKEERS